MQKKLLFFLAALACTLLSIQAQQNIFVSAPVYNNAGTGTLPDGSPSSGFRNGCFLITQPELSELLSTNITSFGFKVYGGSASVSGNFTVYLQNTSDMNYSKGTSYNTAISTMSNVYAGAYTIPAYTGLANTISLNFPSNFNYTGGGLYVAFSWSATTALIPGNGYFASYLGNGSSLSGNKGGYSWGISTNPTMQLSTIRPVCIFGAINTATNEAQVLSIGTPGKIAEALHASYAITAGIKNKSINTLSNITVSLNVSGDNSYTSTYVIPTLAVGAIQTVTFTGFSPAFLGTNTISVSIPLDQNTANNQSDWTQKVTCNIASNSPQLTYNTGYGNLGSPTLMLSRFNFNVTNTLTAVNLAIADDNLTPGITLSGVVMDANGIILATTNTITLSQGFFWTSQTFTFSTPTQLLADQDYYIGMAQSQGYIMAAYVTNTVQPGMFYYADLDGSNLTPINDAYLGIEPVLAGIDLTITQAGTVICNGESITLSAFGATNYTWSASVFNPIDNPNNGSITVAPTSNEMYQLYGVDDAGCSNSASAPVAVKACVGLAENPALENILLYPNPTTNGVCFLTGLESPGTLSVYNILGELVLTEEILSDKVKIDLSQQAAGSYLVKIISTGNGFKLVKLINQK